MLFLFAEQLLEFGYEEAEIVNPIMDYLQDAKANSHLFPKILTYTKWRASFKVGH